MANVFTRTIDANNAPSRNTFDGSFVNNLTLPFGRYVPCFCKEVIPGDSFKIDTEFGFNLQPMVFPVQTDINVNLHFFYVRNRPLWKGWQDFITMTDNKDGDSVPPYLHLTEENRDMVNTCGIGDYMGIPTVYYGSKTDPSYIPLSTSVFPSSVSPASALVYSYLPTDITVNSSVSYKLFVSENNTVENHADLAKQFLSLISTSEIPASFSQYFVNIIQGQIPINPSFLNIPSSYYKAPISFADYGSISLYEEDIVSSILIIYDTTNEKVAYTHRIKYNKTSLGITNFRSYYDETYLNVLQSAVDVNNNAKNLHIEFKNVENSNLRLYTFCSIAHNPHTNVELPSSFVNVHNWQIMIDASNGIKNEELDLLELPFASNFSSDDALRISALPFRAYEAIYNSFYRDDRNNPRIVNGVPVYNDWITTDAGGADTTHYQLYRANWEKDVFTTATQSPQQGVMPLVGVTSTGLMTFRDENGTTYEIQATIGDDGETITGIKSYSSDMPVGTLRAMVDTVSSGISINDFRNVNALQRWLETNMRRGLRYKDQIESHFGVTPTYSELDMPEFIGGMSRKVDMNRVVNVGEDTAEHPLGTLAGNGSLLGKAGAPIKHYCDEHGWIIGIISVVPKPVYSQQLCKQLLKTNILHYYFPEFAHIGPQPIPNSEVAPLQAFKFGTTPEALNDVFGYQRAWYEYLSSLDEVHGEFRTTMKDYLIQRVFASTPQLGSNFLTVDGREIEEVFAVQNENQKMFGQIYFDVSMKRPIPAIGIPKLEV